jgi:YesN/AraC family two-component response regulator
LNCLAANDEGYTLFFIQTCVDKFQNVSSINTAMNGKEALDLVKSNEKADKLL